jgi:hypothetical protein
MAYQTLPLGVGAGNWSGIQKPKSNWNIGNAGRGVAATPPSVFNPDWNPASIESGGFNTGLGLNPDGSNSVNPGDMPIYSGSSWDNPGGTFQPLDWGAAEQASRAHQLNLQKTQAVSPDGGTGMGGNSFNLQGDVGTTQFTPETFGEFQPANLGVGDLSQGTGPNFAAGETGNENLFDFSPPTVADINTDMAAQLPSIDGAAKGQGDAWSWFGGRNAEGNKTNSMVGTGVNLGSKMFGAWTGYRALREAEKAGKFTRAATRTQIANMAKDANTSRDFKYQDAYSGMNSGSRSGYETPAQQAERNKLSGTVNT